MPLTTDLTAALRCAEIVARDVAPALVEGFGTAPHTEKSPCAADVVTKLDVETEERIAEALAKFDLGIPVYGEELGGDESGRTHWLIDPIDGTGHYVRGLAFCTTMIALVDNDQPIVSVINDFIRERLYSAVLGQGATANGSPIHVSDRSLQAAYMGVEINTQIDDNSALYTQIQDAMIAMDSISCGWDYAMVAEGKLDGRISKNPWGKDYDFAAGALLVREAGGVVENIGRRDYRLSNHDFLATNPIVNRELTTGPGALFPAP